MFVTGRVTAEGPRYNRLTLKFEHRETERGFTEWLFGRHWGAGVVVAAMWGISALWCVATLVFSRFTASSMVLCLAVVCIATLSSALACLRPLRHTAAGFQTLLLAVSTLFSLFLTAAPVAQLFLEPYAEVGSFGPEASEVFALRLAVWELFSGALLYTFVLLICPLLTFRIQAYSHLGSPRAAVVSLAFLSCNLSVVLVPLGGFKLWYKKMVIMQGLFAFAAILAVVSFRSELAKRVQYSNLVRLEHSHARSALEVKRQDALLHMILPVDIAGQIVAFNRDNNRSADHFSFAQNYLSAAVLFVEIPWGAAKSPQERLREMAVSFLHLDELCAVSGSEKVKTIGNVVMIAVGVPTKTDDPAVKACELALNIWATEGMYKPAIRIGVAEGPVTAGVIGKTKPKLDMWGDTVNFACRMMQCSEPGGIQLTQATSFKVRGKFVLHESLQNVKGKGQVPVYCLIPQVRRHKELCRSPDSASKASGHYDESQELDKIRNLIASPESTRIHSCSFERPPQVLVLGVERRFGLAFKDRVLEAKFDLWWFDQWFPISKYGWLVFVPVGIGVALPLLLTPWLSREWWKLLLSCHMAVYQVSNLVVLCIPSTRRSPFRARLSNLLTNLVDGSWYAAFWNLGYFSSPSATSIMASVVLQQLFGMMTFLPTLASTLPLVVVPAALFAVLRRSYWDLCLFGILSVWTVNSLGFLLVEKEMRRQYLSNNELQLATEKLEREQRVSEELLRSILPQDILTRLRGAPDIIVASAVPDAVLLFADVVNFTEMCSKMSASTVVTVLDRLFSSIDALVDKHSVWKLKTIGDAYVAVNNVSDPRQEDPTRMFSLAIDILRALPEFNACSGDLLPFPLRLRIGVHRGPLLTGVLLMHAFTFDCWGETMNAAEHIEASAPAGGVLMSDAVLKDVSESAKACFVGEMVTVNDVVCTSFVVDESSLPGTLDQHE